MQGLASVSLFTGLCGIRPRFSARLDKLDVASELGSADTSIYDVLLAPDVYVCRQGTGQSYEEQVVERLSRGEHTIIVPALEAGQRVDGTGKTLLIKKALEQLHEKPKIVELISIELSNEALIREKLKPHKGEKVILVARELGYAVVPEAGVTVLNRLFGENGQIKDPQVTVLAESHIPLHDMDPDWEADETALFGKNQIELPRPSLEESMQMVDRLLKKLFFTNGLPPWVQTRIQQLPNAEFQALFRQPRHLLLGIATEFKRLKPYYQSSDIPEVIPEEVFETLLKEPKKPKPADDP